MASLVALALLVAVALPALGVRRTPARARTPDCSAPRAASLPGRKSAGITDVGASSTSLRRSANF